MGDWMDRWGGHGRLAPHVEGEVVPASGGAGEKKKKKKDEFKVCFHPVIL